MTELEYYIKNYFVTNNIPLKLNNGKCSIIATIKGGGYYLSEFTRQWFPDKPKYIRLYTYILSLQDYKYCSSCEKIRYKIDFHKNNARKDGIESICKFCNNKRTLPYVAKRRAALLDRTPIWADQEAINFFYECCPKGCHVDHIIPLQGKNISGLHIETNLQWLPAKENLSKGNKYG